MPERKIVPPLAGDAAVPEMRRLTRRSFVTGGAAALAGLGAWSWLTNSNREGGVPWPLRRVLRFNERLADGYSSPRHLAPVFPKESVQDPARTNGLIGLAGEATPRLGNCASSTKDAQIR